MERGDGEMVRGEAARKGLPVLYGWREFVEEGGHNVVWPRHTNFDSASGDLRGSHIETRKAESPNSPPGWN